MQVQNELRQLKLDNAPVWKREEVRRAHPDAPKAPLPIRAAYNTLCWVLDIIYDRRPIQRFWFLEVVARMPYFSYISMLHLYESLGWWRAGAELRRVRTCLLPHVTFVGIVETPFKQNCSGANAELHARGAN